MEDMDSVIKPRPPSIKQKKPRPKSVHRDIMESPKPPAQTYTGTAATQFKIYSADCISRLWTNMGIMDINNRHSMKTLQTGITMTLLLKQLIGFTECKALEICTGIFLVEKCYCELLLQEYFVMWVVLCCSPSKLISWLRVASNATQRIQGCISKLSNVPK